MNTRHLRPEDLRGRRWRGLIRESTQDQAEKWSPERQRSDLRRAADDLGLVPAEPMFYERTGSGEETGASEVRAAIADAKRGQYDVLMVLATSRFARNRAEAVRAKAEARAAGLVIYFVAERLISGSYSGHLMEGISEVLDEHANEDRKFWIAGGIREKQATGRWHGTTPFGYRRRMADRPDGSRGSDGGLEHDPDTAPIVRRIYQECLAGRSLRATSIGLAGDGHRGPRGGPWNTRSLSLILQSPVYKGVLYRYRRHSPKHYYLENDGHDGRREIAGDWPPIVDETMWEQAQEALRGRTTSRGPFGPPRDYPFSKVLRCASCGTGMTGKFNGYTRYYRCPAHSNLRPCETPNVRAEIVEEGFARWLGEYELPADWRRRIVPLAGRVAQDDVQARKERLTAQLARLRQLFVLGDLTEPEYRAEAAAIKAELAQTVTPAAGQMEAIASSLVSLGTSWRRAPVDTKRAIVTQILTSATAGPDGVGWVIRPELRPLFEMLEEARDDRGATAAGLYSRVARYTVRFSA